MLDDLCQNKGYEVLKKTAEDRSDHRHYYRLGMCGIEILFRFGFCSDIEKLVDSIRFGISLVLFGLKKLGFGSDNVVIYYLCNT